MSAIIDEFRVQRDAVIARYTSTRESSGSDTTIEPIQHLDHLIACVAAGNPDLFVEYVEWASVVLESRNADAEQIRSDLQALRAACAPFDGDSELEPYFQAALAAIERGAGGSTDVDADAECAPSALTLHYLDHLLSGRRREAISLVVNASKSGTPIEELYLEVFARSQREVGRLWQLNRISVAQEHYCTAVTQQAMSLLYPEILQMRKSDKRCVVACLGDELHEIGARMVSDFLEIRGWDSFFLGANTPTAGLIDMLRSRQAHILGVSATLTKHVPHVAALVREVRAVAGLDVQVIVGGTPFSRDPDLAERVGAAGSADSADAAVELAERTVNRALVTQ